MDNSEAIKNAIASRVCSEAIDRSGSIDRQRLANVVFSDGERLKALNAIVHGAVRADFIAWAAKQQADRIWFETALLYESDFYRLANDAWEITAPQELRISRVMRRSLLTERQVSSRIAAQASGSERWLLPTTVIVNDGIKPLMPQILRLVNNNLPNSSAAHTL